jgi:hypothetical protein
MPKAPANQGSGRPGASPQLVNQPDPPETIAPRARAIKPDPPVIPPIPELPPQAAAPPGKNGLPPPPPPPPIDEVGPPPDVTDPRDLAPKFVPPKVVRLPNPLIV